MRGFEPLKEFPPYRISSAAHSTTLAHLLVGYRISDIGYQIKFFRLKSDKNNNAIKK